MSESTDARAPVFLIWSSFVFYRGPLRVLIQLLLACYRKKSQYCCTQTLFVCWWVFLELCFKLPCLHRSATVGPCPWMPATYLLRHACVYGCRCGFFLVWNSCVFCWEPLAYWFSFDWRVAPRYFKTFAHKAFSFASGGPLTGVWRLHVYIGATSWWYSVGTGKVASFLCRQHAGQVRGNANACDACRGVRLRSVYPPSRDLASRQGHQAGLKSIGPWPSAGRQAVGEEIGCEEEAGSCQKTSSCIA